MRYLGCVKDCMTTMHHMVIYMYKHKRRVCDDSSQLAAVECFEMLLSGWMNPFPEGVVNLHATLPLTEGSNKATDPTDTAGVLLQPSVADTPYRYSAADQ